MDIEKLKSEKTIAELLEFGIVIFDKPADWTSFDVVNFVRGKLKLRKASHFGTLDPMVTGVLPLALNRAVKLTGFFIGEDKEYTGTMHMHEEVSLEEIEKVIEKKFLGKIIQLPPVRSSVKRQEREREIKKFKLLKQNGRPHDVQSISSKSQNKDISFLVECQGGTYVRKLVHDLGEEMEIGAHMTGLRRIRAGIFFEKNCVTKESFEKAVEEYFNGDEKLLLEIIIPAEIVSEIYPSVEVKEENVEQLFHGSPLHEEFIVAKDKEIKENQTVCVFCKSKFVGMYKTQKGKIFAQPQFVLQKINK